MYCSKCGEEHKSVNRYCTNCGTPLKRYAILYNKSVLCKNLTFKSFDGLTVQKDACVFRTLFAARARVYKLLTSRRVVTYQVVMTYGNNVVT